MASNIPIVQGVAVPHNKTSDYHSVAATPDTGAHNNPTSYYHVADVPTSYNTSNVNDMQQLRESPIKQYQDVIWAILFIVHFIAMITLIVYSFMNPVTIYNDDGSTSTTDVSAMNGKILFLTATTGMTAVGLSAISFSLMMHHAKLLVEIGLIFSVATSLVIAIVGFMMGNIWMGVAGIISFLIGICYTYAVWSRIPFAAANLNTALTAVRANMGLTVVSLFFTLLAFGWTVVWFLGVGGAYLQSNGAVMFILVRTSCHFWSYF
jgi:Plasma-membrane choline transporter